MLTVAEIMTAEPYTLGPDDTLAQARALMAEHHIRHIPVVAGDGCLVGIVSHRDVLAAGCSSLQAPSVAMVDERRVTLSTIMSSPVQTVDEQASLRGTALHLMKHRVGCLAVMRNTRLVGIITDADFVAIAANLMEQIEQSEAEPDDLDEEQFDDGY